MSMLPMQFAKGGKLPTGKPVLVGEEGPELILPRDDGTGFVLPADVTDDVLPMMMGDVKPRKDGGKIAYRAEGGAVPYEVLQTPSGAFRGVTGQYGSGFASARPLPGQGNKLTGDPALPAFMADPSGRYQIDRAAPGMPILPDMEGMGEWAEPGLPVTPEMLNANRQQIAGRLNVLRQTGGAPEDFMMVTDQATGEQIPQSEMLQRVSMRGQVHAGEIGARREAADRARLAALPPIGTRPPGIDPTQRRMDRQMERFMRTPQGMMFALEQGQQGQLANQRAQLASTALPVTDPATGQVMGWTNGLGASLSSPPNGTNKTLHKIDTVNGVPMKFYKDGTFEPVAPGGVQSTPSVAINPMGEMVNLAPNIDPTSLPPGWTVLRNRPTAEVGGATTAPAPTAASSTVKPASRFLNQGK